VVVAAVDEAGSVVVEDAAGSVDVDGESGSIDVVVDDDGESVVDDVIDVDGVVDETIGRSIGVVTAMTGPPRPSSKIVVGATAAVGDVDVVVVVGGVMIAAADRCGGGVVVEVVVVAASVVVVVVVLVVDVVVGRGGIVSEVSGVLSPTCASTLADGSLVAGSPARDAVPVGADPSAGFAWSVEPGEFVLRGHSAASDSVEAASEWPGSAAASAAAAIATSTTSVVARPLAILR
jgi:hypothetical protein